MGSSQRYGPPLFFAAWVSVEKIAAALVEEEEKNEAKEEVDGTDAGSEGEDRSEGLQREEAASEGQPAGGSEASSSGWLALVGGGGGEGRSGVPNALLLAGFDPASESLSENPVFNLGLQGEAPYRMAVHPAGKGVVCSFPTCCRWFIWLLREGKLALAPGKLLSELDDGVMQLALAFNGEGTLLATGGEDGHLRVFKWPSMELVIDKNSAHKCVNNLDFSPDGKFLVSVGDKDEPCRVWDLTSFSVFATLSRENGESFRLCRFSQTVNHNEILYVISIQDDRAKVSTWDPKSWKRIGSHLIARDPVSAFNVSLDGKLLACGTIEGEVIVARSIDMRIVTKVKKAHLGFVTALAFKEPRVLLSSSIDATARVIVVEEKKTGGAAILVVFIILALAILIYYLKSLELLPRITKT